MGTIDIIILLCFIPAIVKGLTKGLVEQLVSLVSLLAGVWLAFRFSQPLAEMVATWNIWDLLATEGEAFAVDGKIVGIVCFAVIVIVTIFVLALIGKVITKALSLASLGWINRLLGLGFALFKTALVVGLILYVFDPINTKWGLVGDEVLKNSVLYEPLKAFALKVFPFLKELILNA